MNRPSTGARATGRLPNAETGESTASSVGRVQRASTLRIGASDDAYEREAERAASAVVSGGRPLSSSFSLSRIPVRQVRREEKKEAAKEGEKYKEGAKKVGEAFLETPLGKKLRKKLEELPVVEGAKDFAETLHGKVIIGSAAVGAVAALAATGSELPAQIPGIPLDSLAPGLKVRITYEGPLNNPARAMISFSYTEQARPSGKAGPTPAERRRSENARMAEELYNFRRSLRYPPGSPQAMERQARERAVRDVVSGQSGKLPDPDATESHPGLPPQPEKYRLQLPEIWRARRISLLEKELELRPSNQVRETQGPDERNKKEEEEPAPVQRHGQDRPGADLAPAAVREVVGTPGQPLDPETRGFMEGRFRHDFSRVRVHTDALAATSARAIQADAYTTGHHVVFGAGRFAPRTPGGRRLLAHELAHVVQQTSGGGGVSALGGEGS